VTAPRYALLSLACLSMSGDEPNEIERALPLLIRTPPKRKAPQHFRVGYLPKPCCDEPSPRVFDVYEWALAATFYWRPSYHLKAFGIDSGNPYIKDKVVAQETKMMHEERRRRIVDSMVGVALDERNAPLFTGPYARERTALFMLAILHFESAYDLRVDLHHCAGYPKAYCDGGRAWCLAQIHPGPVYGFTAEGWTGKELQADRRKCFTAQLHILQQSQAMCPEDRATWKWSAPYASGQCWAKVPVDVMKTRWDAYEKWMSLHPVGVARPGA